MQKTVKRLFDICVSFIALIITAPIIIIVAIGIKITSPGPILFIQDRAGKNGKVFKMYKFRSMLCGMEDYTLGRYITKDEECISPFGRFLRRWALDELPQLFNILKGEMSLVGPRPPMAYQILKYNDTQKRRLRVKPGLTGWAQVNGRNKLNWTQRIEYDVWYVDNWSLTLDLKIIMKTIPALLNKEFAFADEDTEKDDIVDVE